MKIEKLKSTKAPLEVFKQTVRYFPMLSLNLVLRNEAGDFLFLKRKNAPMQGEHWLPGGRILNGETLQDAAKRLLFSEVGLQGELLYISPAYVEERFEVDDFEDQAWLNYDPETQLIHYFSIPVLMEIDLSHQSIALDGQSSAYLWQKDLPHDHPYLKKYFDLLNSHL